MSWMDKLCLRCKYPIGYFSPYKQVEGGLQHSDCELSRTYILNHGDEAPPIRNGDRVIDRRLVMIRATHA